MKSILLYSLLIACCAQPALAETDEEWQQQAAKEMQATSHAQQPAKMVNTAPKQGAKQSTKQSAKQQFNALKQQFVPSGQLGAGNFSLPVRHSGMTGYGYRPQRGNVRSGYGWRPQRAQLMPQGYSQEMLQQKMQNLQRMQQMMGGGGQQQGQLPMMGAGGQQQQQKPNILQMLMGGGGGGGQEQQQQQGGQPQMNRGELLKTFFGSGESSDQNGQ